MKKLAFLLMTAGTPALAVDPCLVGVWEADVKDMAHLLSVQMNAKVTAKSGRTSMQILPDGELTLLAEDVVFVMDVPGAPPFDVTVTGYSNGSMDTDGRAFNTFISDYNVVGSADVMGERMEIPVTSGSAPWGSATGIFGCTETGIAFEATALGSIPRSWTRVR